MKVLFAVNNDGISDAIVKKYQKEYKEIISYKNVYYFNAILKELQNNKNYDCVVISEDLEPFANNNFDTIDKFLFEKLDKISDEATKANGDSIEIILICSDRRSKSDDMLTKIFGIGIYNALIGDDRNIDNLCKLIYQPRNKKEAKIAYKIEGTNVGYQSESENNVSEAEVQNILAHYKRLGKDEDKYVDSFNNIVSQYTDTQLKIIIRYLPLNVKAVLEERSPKYQELATFSSNRDKKNLNEYQPRIIKEERKQDTINVRMLEKEKDNITKPIVIPSALNIKNKNKIEINDKKNESDGFETDLSNNIKELSIDELNDNIQETEIKKKGRGRPRKNPNVENMEEKPKRGRGRPKKIEVQEEIQNLDIVNDEIDDDDLDLFSMDEDEKLNTIENIDIAKDDNTENNEEEFDLFSMDDNDEQENPDLFNISEENGELDVDLFSMNEEEEDSDSYKVNQYNNEDRFDSNNKITKSTANTSLQNLNSLLTKEKKVVSFVGTTKNGTSFIVNNLAMVLSSMNISTAILDLTKNKNTYYIYTKNEQRLRNIAENSITELSKGIAKGIEVNKNLTVFTGLPGKETESIECEDIMVTLLNNYNVVLIDADFDTPIDYFEKSQEIYLVQSMDILTIQPLTAFLRMLKAKNILEEGKIKIVINKEQKMKNLTDKLLIGGMSSYNDPAMSYMTELFDKNKVFYTKVPFESQNYVKYIDSIVNCELSLKGYTKQLINALNELAEKVYPLISRQAYTPMGNKKSKMEFSNFTKDTLNKMKNNY